MTKREAMDLVHQENRLVNLGILREDAEALRRISMTLRRWFERECGDGHGCIERDEATGQPFWSSSHVPHRHRITDRETGAKKRLAAIMAKYPTLTPYIQGDPRGCSLYILRSEDLADGHDIDSIYTRGVAIT